MLRGAGRKGTTLATNSCAAFAGHYSYARPDWPLLLWITAMIRDHDLAKGAVDFDASVQAKNIRTTGCRGSKAGVRRRQHGLGCYLHLTLTE
ncbi:MAG: hypothetical protein ACI9BH_001816 [Paracoccaceae bacterium]|jgi:hypothetical protein